MTGQEERSPTAGAPPPGEDAGPSGVRTDEADLEPASPEPSRDELGEFPLTRPARDERRVGGVDADQPARERDDVRVVGPRLGRPIRPDQSSPG
ncbi:hypothetical protein BCL57_002269 [Agromyces flavus]|uniref:Uncharacterized protein n=1 Tax=Agromyces flavus TaxID=589382 RepID=A0ABT1KMH4_9MICO|nr:hypothetical protein [Agromyces flavus]MCP2368096.1 hypothetical protein [Agromyces flavus]